MFCKKCGAQLADNVSFCQNCGEPTGSPAEPVQPVAEVPVQSVAPVQPETEASAQPVEPVQPVQPEAEASGQPVEPVQPTAEAPAQQADVNPAMIPGGKKEKKKHTKAIIIAVCVVVVCILAAVVGFFAYKAYQNKPENKFKRTVKEFEKQLEAENYSKAKELINIDGDVYGSFEDFAQQCLKGAKLKETKDGYTLTSDQGTYTLTSSKDGEKIVPTDMYMDVKVKCSTYLYYNPLKGYGNIEVQEDGMTLYTIKTYKAHQFNVESCIALGNETDNGTRIAIVEATTDDDYAVDSITAAYSKDDETNTYNGAYLEDDGTIVFDMYYISESYAETVARTFSGLGTDMSNSALGGDSFEQFYARYEDYVFDTDLVEAEYESLLKSSRSLSYYVDSVDMTATQWTYPQQFRYSNGQYVLNVTVKNTAYKNNKEKGSSTSSAYVLFKPGMNRFKVFAFADSESDIYDAKEVSGSSDVSDADTGDMDDWQLAYIDYLNENQSDIGHASLGYLNDDDIPELFIIDEENPSHGCSVQIYSYIDGEVKQITADSIGYKAFGSYGDVGYFEKTGIIVSMNSGMGAEEEIYIMMHDDGSTEILLELYGADTDMSDKAKYYIGDAEVTYDEWEAARNNAKPDNQEMSNAPGEDYTAQDIINQISQM